MELKPVNSSSVSHVGYDNMKGDLHVKFRKGDTYIYHNVPESAHTALMGAPSIGKHLAKHIVSGNRYRFSNAKK